MLPDSTYVDVAGVPWQPTRFPGVEWKILLENKATGMSTALTRWAPGARLPVHAHVAIEQTVGPRSHPQRQKEGRESGYEGDRGDGAHGKSHSCHGGGSG